MTRSQKGAVLWFVGAAAFLLAGLIGEPRRLLSIGTGLLLLAAGIVSMTRSRRDVRPD